MEGRRLSSIVLYILDMGSVGTLTPGMCQWLSCLTNVVVALRGELVSLPSPDCSAACLVILPSNCLVVQHVILVCTL